MSNRTMRVTLGLSKPDRDLAERLAHEVELSLEAYCNQALASHLAEERLRLESGRRKLLSCRGCGHTEIVDPAGEQHWRCPQCGEPLPRPLFQAD